MDAAWLTKHGYSTALRSHYLSAGWLNQPARSVYRRGQGELTWQQAVISLQTLLGHPLLVGGRTALELQGYATTSRIIGWRFISTAPRPRQPGWKTSRHGSLYRSQRRQIIP